MELGPSKEAEEWLRIAIADALEKHVRPRLPDLGGYKITLLARVDGRPEADVLVTEDERSAVFAMIDRRLGTPGPRVPGAVVIGPPGTDPGEARSAFGVPGGESEEARQRRIAAIKTDWLTKLNALIDNKKSAFTFSVQSTEDGDVQMAGIRALEEFREEVTRG